MIGTRPRKTRRRSVGFTLTEMIVVIAIIVVLIGIAIPAVRALTGGRNGSAAYNELNAILGQARQDALALQTVHGIVFYLDPANDRIYAMYVQSVAPPTTLPTLSSVNSPQVWLDTVPNREQMALPNGVGLQTIANPNPLLSTPQFDRYLGFNPASPCKYGGVILFDANGRLVTQTYCLLCANVFGGSTSNPGPVPNASTTGSSTYSYPQSQFGFVVFDRDAFLAQGYSDGDDGLDSTVSTYGTPTTAGSEAAEEQWLDANSTPALVNRYNGTLIKGE